MARTLAEYLKHLDLFGPQGVLEAAQRDLSEAEHAELAKRVEAAPKPPKRRSRRRGRSG